MARLALATATAGVLFLFLLSLVLEPVEASIAEIDESMQGLTVSVSARVDSVLHKETFVIFTLNDGTGKLKVVVFNPSNEQRQLLQRNNFVSVEGKIQVYKNELEMVAKSVGQWQ